MKHYKIMRRGLSILLSLLLCLSLLPTVAFAEEASDGTAEIQLGAGGIQTNDVVYYGVYTEDGTNYEIPWYALDTNGFLLSKYTIGTSIFRNKGDNGYYNYSTTRMCEDSSVLKNIMDGLYNGAGTTLFSDLEQGAIKKTTLTGESMHDSSTPSVQAHLFPLSRSEARSIEKSQWKTQEITDPEGKGQDWWIRTSDVDNLANYMYSMSYSNTYIHVSKAVRPAFNLNLDAVLFTSTAVGGKNGVNIGLKKVGDNNGNEWKLTLKDSSRKFAVTETTASCKPGDAITLNYTGATIKTDDAPNEYISAVIADSSGIQYYGKIAQPTTEAGAIRITIPFSLAAGTYTLYVFSEQCNGDKRTDYASDLKCISLTVNNTPRPSDGDTPAIILGTSSLGTGDIVYFGTYGATGVPWYMLDNYGFMLSKYTLGNSDFRGDSSSSIPVADEGYYNYSTTVSAISSSVLKKTMDGLYNGTNTTLFSDLEQDAIKETILSKESMYADDDRVTDVNAHLFPLSKAEAEVLASEVIQAQSITNPEKGATWWWLRSSYSKGSAHIVHDDGSINYIAIAAPLGVRPAFNLDMNSVLFASAAVDGKSDTTVDGNLTEVSAYSDLEWKLTLRDSGRDGFTASTAAVSDNTLTVRYENAKTGENEYISAIAKAADGSVSYYGRIVQLDGETNGASGTVSITLPDSTDTLFVFNEQYNGDKVTDYASNLCTVFAKKSIADCTVDPIPKQTYNHGTPLTPDVTVKDGDVTLTKGTDYTVFYENNVNACNTNGATAIITGVGNYSGELRQNFTIGRAEPIKPTDLTGVEGQALSTVKLPSGWSWVSGEQTLIIGQTYLAYYSGSANYSSGHTYLTVTLQPKPVDTTTMTVTQEGCTYGDTLPGYALSDKPAFCSENVLYTGTLAKDGSDYSDAEKPTEAGTYTVKVTCGTKEKNYEATASFTIDPRSIEDFTVTLSDTELAYTGDSQSVTVTKVGNLAASLAAGDYEASGTSGTNAGEYTVTVTGKGNYVGTATAPWSITKKALTISGAAAKSRDYAEGNVSVDIDAVNFGNVTLVMGSDYTVAGRMNDDKAGSEKQVYVSVTLLNSNYALNNAEAETTVTIRKIDPAAPTGLTGFKDRAISTVSLPDGWTWDVPDTKLDATGEQTFKASYKDSTGNYNDVSSVDVTVTVNSSGGGYISTVQKPVIEGDAGAAWTLSSDGTKLTISAKEGFTLADVTLNGVSKGQVAELNGLKTGDKVVIRTVNDADVLAEKLAAVKLVARSKMSAANGKAAIKVYWFAEDGSDINFDGYEIFRSTKRYSGYGKTPFFETGRETYWNTAIKGGNTYYYKVRGYIELNGERYYTEWSKKAWRTVK